METAVQRDLRSFGFSRKTRLGALMAVPLALILFASLDRPNRDRFPFARPLSPACFTASYPSFYTEIYFFEQPPAEVYEISKAGLLKDGWKVTSEFPPGSLEAESAPGRTVRFQAPSLSDYAPLGTTCELRYVQEPESWFRQDWFHLKQEIFGYELPHY